MRSIRLFYWSTVRAGHKDSENYGDLLSKYIVEKVSGRPVAFYDLFKKKKIWFRQKHLLAIGSIMNLANPKSHIWGSGIISKSDTFNTKAIYAVRGPKTRGRALELGHNCPEVYGDPALLLPNYFHPEVEQTHDLGIIPHYVDYKLVSEWYADDDRIKVIDLLTKDVEGTTREILSCRQTISSSLHGVIVSHAYQIPSIWARFSEKLSGDNVKFEDYFLSAGLKPYVGKLFSEALPYENALALAENSNNLPSLEAVKNIQDELLSSFPEI